MINAFRGVGRFGYFCLDAVVSAFTTLPNLRRLVEEMYRVGAVSLPVVGAVSIFVGTNIALQGYNLFEDFGTRGLVGVFVGLACVREMAPILAGAMVAAKAGSEMASSIATMKTREQLDALEVISVDPQRYLVAPKFVATVLMLPLLVVFADLISMASGYAVAVHQLGVNKGAFMADLLSILSMKDIVFGMIKGLVFGGVISLYSCYQGFQSGPGARGVGKATNKAIVGVSVICIVINYFLSEMMYG